MRAARMFTLALAEQGVMTSVTRVLSEMFGSLGATGKGHGTDSAVLLGLSGHEPDTSKFVDRTVGSLRDV